VTDEKPEEILARVSHEWHNLGGNILKVKELQTFKRETTSEVTLCPLLP
jgi:hypothetical protein